jgi:cytochrome c553
MRKSIFLLATALFATAAAAAESADEAAEKLATQVCTACHGPGGVSTSPQFPRLAAQPAPYLVAQIKAFRANTRGEPEAHDYMLGMVTLIDDATAEALGRYFARQAPAPGTPGDAKRVAQGRQVFEHGIAERGIAACATCHGAHAEGNTIFPRLAGQHAAYLVKQLKAIQSRLRQSPVMHGIIKDLTPAEMDALAAYLQSLG